MKKLSARKIFNTIVVSVSFLMVLHSSYLVWKIHSDTIIKTQNEVNQQADISVTDINNRLLYVMKTGQDFADAISSGKVPYREVEAYAKQIMVENHDGNNEKPSRLYNLGVSFARGAYDSRKPEQLANWVFVADKDNGEITLLQRNYDYTVRDGTTKNDWFVDVIEHRKPFWKQPKFGDVSNRFLVSYSIPFFAPGSRQVAGAVSIGFSTAELQDFMAKQDYRRIGFGIVESDQGSLIYHPNDLMPLLDISHYYEYFKPDFSFVRQINNQTDQSRGTLYSSELPTTHEKVWVLSKTIPASNWQYKVVFLENQLGIESQTLQPKINLTVALIIFFAAFSSVLFIHSDKKVSHLWLFSLTIGIAFSIGTVLLWRFADGNEPELSRNMSKIKSVVDIKQYQDSQNQFFSARHLPLPFYVPTGVSISSTEFLGSNSLIVSGYIWQKYRISNTLKPNNVPENFCDLASDSLPGEKSILLVDAMADNENNVLSCDNASYKVANEHTVTLGWYFKAQVRQPFEYSKFPLDKNLIWLRMRPNNPSGNIILTPDFDSYSNIYEKSFMGVDKQDLILPSWKILGTFFSSKTNSLNSNFGVMNNSQQASQDLLFNIAIKRNFLDSVFSTVIPIFIIYLILFVVLFSSLDDLLAVLGINAGLLFSVALWHSTLRTNLSSAGVTYFETYYFVCYFVISLVCINSVLLACKLELPWLTYKNNLLPKLIFLPLVSGITFIISVSMLF